MSSQPRKHAAADVKLLPWPQPRSTVEGVSVTRWVMDFDRLLVGTDAEVVAARLPMQDPSLQVNVTLEHGDRIVITVTWRENYDADALSRSSVALQLITQVVGGQT